MLKEQVFAGVGFLYFRVYMAILPAQSFIFMIMTLFPLNGQGQARHAYRYGKSVCVLHPGDAASAEVYRREACTMDPLPLAPSLCYGPYCW